MFGAHLNSRDHEFLESNKLWYLNRMGEGVPVSIQKSKFRKSEPFREQ